MDLFVVFNVTETVNEVSANVRIRPTFLFPFLLSIGLEEKISFSTVTYIFLWVI